MRKIYILKQLVGDKYQGNKIRQLKSVFKAKTVPFLSLNVLVALLSSCGSSKGSKPSAETDVPSDLTTTTSSQVPLLPLVNNVVLKAGDALRGVSGVNDIITATSITFINDTSVVDENPYDSDELTVTAFDDILETPLVDGIEKIIFTTSENKLGTDTVFDVDLDKISNYDLISFENSSNTSAIISLNLKNVSGHLAVGKHFSIVNINAKKDSDINLSTQSNITLSTTGITKDLKIDANGKSFTLASTDTAGDIFIEDADSISISAENAMGDITLIGNGDVTIVDASKLKGNINVTSVGEINLLNATEALGTLTLNNERAPAGSDIIINNANSVGSAYLNSAGSITTTSNNGLASAKIVSASFSEASIILADGVENQIVTLSGNGSSNKTIHVELHASTLETLSLAGSAPIIVEVDGNDISTETVTNTNSNATLHLLGANTDLSNVTTSVNLWLKNHDGKTLIINDNQNIFLDAEQPQTANSSVPMFDHTKDATSLTTNNFTLKSHDTNKLNSDKVANFSGLNFTDVQRVTFDTASGIDFEGSGNITGVDLKEVLFVGSGKFDLYSNTITGNSTNRVIFDGSSATGAVSFEINSTSKGVANVKTGTASDFIKIDGITSDAGGFVVNTGGGIDTIHISSSAGGPAAKINLNGGNGDDTLKLDAAVDLSSSNLTLSSIETIFIEGGGVSQKIAASDISGQSFSISDFGSGSSTLTVSADQSTINLSSLTFDASFMSGIDTLSINGSTFASAINATGSTHSDSITGSNANDTLLGGSGNDIINGGTGDDIIEGQAGADTLTGGAGDDEFDFIANSSTELLMDKITDFQAAAAESHNDKIDNVTGAKGANTSSINVRNAISGGNGSETVTASVSSGIVTLAGSDAGQINTLSEWIDAVSIDGVIAKAADDADSIGTVAFQLSGNTYIVESNDTFDNNTPNVSIISVIELTGLTGVNAVADAAAANTILVA